MGSGCEVLARHWVRVGLYVRILGANLLRCLRRASFSFLGALARAYADVLPLTVYAMAWYEIYAS